MEIRHIPGKKNPADSLSRQLISDALVRKSSVKDANEEYVMRLRVSEKATDEQIQSTLQKLFNSNQSVQGPQGHSQCPQGSNENKSPRSVTMEDQPSVIAPTAVSKLQLDNSFRHSLYSLLSNKAPYNDIIDELESGKTQVVKKDEIYKRMNGILAVHSHHQDAEFDFWRIVVPDNVEMKEKIVQELHSTLYSAHPRIQRTIARFRRSFCWKGMLGDVRQSVETYPVC